MQTDEKIQIWGLGKFGEKMVAELEYYDFKCKTIFSTDENFIPNSEDLLILIADSLEVDITKYYYVDMLFCLNREHFSNTILEDVIIFNDEYAYSAEAIYTEIEHILNICNSGDEALIALDYADFKIILSGGLKFHKFTTKISYKDEQDLTNQFNIELNKFINEKTIQDKELDIALQIISDYQFSFEMLNVVLDNIMRFLSTDSLMMFSLAPEHLPKNTLVLSFWLKERN